MRYDIELVLRFILLFDKDEINIKKNEIAHGNYLTVDREEYIELHIEIMGMLDVFRNQIENAAVNKDYMRN